MFAIAGFLGLVLAPTPGAGPPAPPGETYALGDALAIEPGATCIDPPRLTARVHAWLGRTQIDARIAVRVHGGTADPQRVVFEVLTRGEVSAVREFNPAPPSCDDLHEIVSVAIALAIDATQLERTPPAVPIEDPTIPSPAPSERRPQAPPPSGPEARAPVAWKLRGSLAAGAVLVTPPPAAGLGFVALEAQWRETIDLALGLVAGSTGRQSLDQGSTTMTFVAGRMHGCAGPPLGAAGIVRVRGCVSILVATVFASGRGFAQDRSVRLPWVTFGAGPHLRFRLAPKIALDIGGEVWLAAVRPALDVVDSTGGRRVGREFPRVGGFVSTGLSFHLR